MCKTRNDSWKCYAMSRHAYYTAGECMLQKDCTRILIAEPTHTLCFGRCMVPAATGDHPNKELHRLALGSKSQQLSRSLFPKAVCHQPKLFYTQLSRNIRSWRPEPGPAPFHVPEPGPFPVWAINPANSHLRTTHTPKGPLTKSYKGVQIR